MKYTLSLMAALLPLVTLAQKVELGVGVGLSTNSLPNDGLSNTATAFPPCVSLQGGYLWNPRLVVGISLSITKWNDRFIGPFSDEKTEYVHADPVVAIDVFANHSLIEKGKHHPYVGVAAGYISAGGGNVFEKGNGFNAGLNLGYTYDLDKRFGLNVELSPRYAWVNSKIGKVYENDYSIFYFPLTLGVRCRL